MGWFRRDSTSDEQSFRHGSGHDSLADVISEQSPKYDAPEDVTRPRGRAYRLHPDEAPPTPKEPGWIPPLHAIPDADGDGDAVVRHLWERADNRTGGHQAS
ncbi:MAG: hypothetical protein ACOYNI_01585 [Acidimicrobiia bacterium]